MFYLRIATSIAGQLGYGEHSWCLLNPERSPIHSEGLDQPLNSSGRPFLALRQLAFAPLNFMVSL